jgi:hypothetical protein
MTKLVFSLAALAAAAMLAATPPATAQSQTTTAGAVRLAQADVNVRVATPTVRKRVVKKKVVVRPAVRSRTVVTTGAAPRCRTVTVRKRVNNRVVVSKVRRC